MSRGPSPARSDDRPSRVAAPEQSPQRGAELLHVAAVLAGYTVIALFLTRPLLWSFAERTPVAYPGTAFDIPFNAWILSWVTHALTTNPLELFSANIYHPMPDALAYTEHMLGSIPFFAPALLATGNPAIALNVMILCGLVLSAGATYWVTWRWTGRWPAAALAGLLFGFYPAHVRALGPNLQTLQYFPLILLCLDGVLAGGGPLATLCLTMALLGQCLASYYYAYPAVLATAVATAAVYLTPATRPSLATLVRVAVALGTTAVVMMSLSLPYFRVRAGGTHTYYAISSFGTPPSTPHGILEALVRLGPAAVVLASAGILIAFLRHAEAAPRRRVTILIAWLVVGLLLFAGPSMWVAGRVIPLPAALLRDYAPGYAALRDANRLFSSAEIALAVLAGVGVSALAGLVAGTRWRATTASLVALCGVAATAYSFDLSPLKLMRLDSGGRTPPIYRSLAALEPGPVLELPIGAADDDLQGIRIQTNYEYFSTFHRRPLLNGYASYWPPQFETVMAMARALPDPRALANLVACTGVRWILVHEGGLPIDRLMQWRRPIAGLEPTAREEMDVLYRVTEPGNAAACRAGLANDASASLEGTPRAALSAETRRGRLASASAAARQHANAFTTGHVRLQNPTSDAWPGLGVGDAGLVQVEAQWLDESGAALSGRGTSTRLPFDVRPDETVDVPVAIHAPKQPGNYLLRFAVSQSPDLPFVLEGPGTAPLRVRVE